MRALGIVVKSPQPAGARTCNEKPDPLGNAQLLNLQKKKVRVLKLGLSCYT